MRVMTICIALLAVPALGSTSEAPRFSGSGELSPPPPTSSDGRFTLTADLQARDDIQTGGRFDLVAKLVASDQAKATTAACIPGLLFENGFETAGTP